VVLRECKKRIKKKEKILKDDIFEKKHFLHDFVFHHSIFLS
jgi:hypothetical protein